MDLRDATNRLLFEVHKSFFFLFSIFSFSVLIHIHLTVVLLGWNSSCGQKYSSSVLEVLFWKTALAYLIMDGFKRIIRPLFLWNSPNVGWLLRVLKMATKHWVTLAKRLNLKRYDHESWLLKTVGLQWGVFLTKGSLNMCFCVCSSCWHIWKV